MNNDLNFQWHPETRIIYGKRRAAVYNFRTKEVFSLNSQAAHAAQRIDSGKSLSAMDFNEIEFVEQLQRLKLGQLSNVTSESVETITNNGFHPLNFLWLELTGGCNLGCVHCYAESQNPVLFPNKSLSSFESPLTFDNWQDILYQGSALSCRRVQFIGGEALLYPRLLELIDAARSAGYTFIEVYTNGTLLTDHKVNAFAERGVHLAVSLHGTQAEVHDAVTGLPGSFNRTLMGLRMLRAHGVPVRIAGVAVRSNQRDVIHLDEIAQELGVAEVSFDVVRGIGSGDDPDLMPNDPSVLAQKWLTWPNFVANQTEYEHNLRWNSCWAGKLAITSTGDVMPCVMGRSEVVGNIREAMLDEILETPRLLYLWGITKDKVAVCQDCEYRYLCGDCRPLAASTNAGDLHGAIPRCTYNPQIGDWGMPGTDFRFPGPAPESDRPMIASAGKHHLNEPKHLRGEPDSTLPEESGELSYDLLHTVQQPVKYPNHHFHCDPDR
jgi:radical SAM protein with 4Fe4S-binding SPASM domain